VTPAEAAQSIYQCLLEMGEAGSNPVLEVLPADGRVVEARHYPDPWMEFAGAPLRAYYHCHLQPTRIAGEHGHFHLFLQVDEERWTHLGALSMDRQGQPRALFSTNRWVTDEHWLETEAMARLALPEPPAKGLSRLETWLFAILHLLYPRFLALWEIRDACLSEIIESAGDGSMLENREYYVLGQLPVDLLTELEAALSTRVD
jgi:hypothetical protein